MIFRLCHYANFWEDPELKSPGGDRQVFHCHLLRQPEKLRELLLSGLEQSGFTQAPWLLGKHLGTKTGPQNLMFVGL